MGFIHHRQTLSSSHHLDAKQGHLVAITLSLAALSTRTLMLIHTQMHSYAYM